MPANLHSDSPIKLQQLQGKHLCFICNDARVSDNNKFRKGGLGRRTDEKVGNKLLQRRSYYLNDCNHRFHDAATRLQIIISGGSHDIYAADVYYRQSFYFKFTLYPVSTGNSKRTNKNEIRDSILNEFYSKVRKNILHQKIAFLLSDLLVDVNNLCSDYELDEPIITNTKQLKRKLVEHVGDIIFFPNGKYVIVHASDINPCHYKVATIKGKGI